MALEKKALVRGEPAQFWRVAANHLVLHHPRGTDYTEVPLSHLGDEAAVRAHAARLWDKDWVPREAIDEFLEIAAGTAA